jgi:hypothetical protein
LTGGLRRGQACGSTSFCAFAGDEYVVDEFWS